MKPHPFKYRIGQHLMTRPGHLDGRISFRVKTRHHGTDGGRPCNTYPHYVRRDGVTVYGEDELVPYRALTGEEHWEEADNLIEDSLLAPCPDDPWNAMLFASTVIGSLERAVKHLRAVQATIRKTHPDM